MKSARKKLSGTAVKKGFLLPYCISQHCSIDNSILSVLYLPSPRYMTSLRAFRPQDLFRANLTNLDPLTENYNIDYYLHYLTQWPSLFTVAEDQYERIAGYSMN